MCSTASENGQNHQDVRIGTLVQESFEPIHAPLVNTTRNANYLGCVLQYIFEYIRTLVALVLTRRRPDEYRILASVRTSGFLHRVTRPWDISVPSISVSSKRNQSLRATCGYRSVLPIRMHFRSYPGGGAL